MGSCTPFPGSGSAGPSRVSAAGVGRGTALPVCPEAGVSVSLPTRPSPSSLEAGT